VQITLDTRKLANVETQKTTPTGRKEYGSFNRSLAEIARSFLAILTTLQTMLRAVNGHTKTAVYYPY